MLLPTVTELPRNLEPTTGDTFAQDLRSADAIDAATRPALKSQAGTRADAAPKVAVDRGIAWATIAIGIAGSLLAVGVIAGIASRTRRAGRARITA